MVLRSSAQVSFQINQSVASDHWNRHARQWNNFGLDVRGVVFAEKQQVNGERLIFTGKKLAQANDMRRPTAEFHWRSCNNETRSLHDALRLEQTLRSDDEINVHGCTRMAVKSERKGATHGELDARLIQATCEFQEFFVQARHRI